MIKGGRRCRRGCRILSKSCLLVSQDKGGEGTLICPEGGGSGGEPCMAHGYILRGISCLVLS